MKSRIKFPLMAVLAGFVCVGLVHGAATSPPTASTESNVESSVAGIPTYPYSAEITGNNVNIRTGPGTSFYRSGQFNKGDKVTIVGNEYGVWSKIEPPVGSYAWISSQYVEVDSINPTAGTVTGTNVNVWAGSDIIKPSDSENRLIKLNTGDKVRLLGQELEGYQKIAPPAGSVYYVSTDYTKPIAAISEDIPDTFANQVPFPEPDLAVETITETIPENIGISDTIETEVDPENVTSQLPAADMPTEANAPVEVVEIVREKTPTEKYQDLQQQLEAERAKAIDQQDYAAIREGLEAISKDEDAGNVSRYAEILLQQVESYQLALDIGRKLKLQNEQLEQTRAQIHQTRIDKLQEIEDLGKYAATGTLRAFVTFGAGHYRIVGEDNKTICIASPNKPGQDYSSLIGKKVGLIGTIEANSATAGAQIMYDEIVALE